MKDEYHLLFSFYNYWNWYHLPFEIRGLVWHHWLPASYWSWLFPTCSHSSTRTTWKTLQFLSIFNKWSRFFLLQLFLLHLFLVDSKEAGCCALLRYDIIPRSQPRFILFCSAISFDAWNVLYLSLRSTAIMAAQQRFQLFAAVILSFNSFLYIFNFSKPQDRTDSEVSLLYQFGAETHIWKLVYG